MKEELGKVIIELLRDAKSRKFISTLGFGGFVAANYHYGWGIPNEVMLMCFGVVAIYILIEGLADYKAR